jgi:hypothetical protein
MYRETHSYSKIWELQLRYFRNETRSLWLFQIETRTKEARKFHTHFRGDADGGNLYIVSVIGRNQGV